jgi:hypothetical protein
MTQYQIGVRIWSTGGAFQELPDLITVGQDTHDLLVTWGLFPDYSSDPRPDPKPYGSWQDRLAAVLLQNIQQTMMPVFFGLSALVLQMKQAGTVTSTDPLFSQVVDGLDGLNGVYVPRFNDLIAFYTYIAPYMYGGATAFATPVVTP